MSFRLAGNALGRADETMIAGKVGADLTVEQGYEAAKLCGLDQLVNMIAAAGMPERPPPNSNDPFTSGMSEYVEAALSLH